MSTASTGTHPAGHTVGERRYVRFRDEWTEPLAQAPQWYTAVYIGTTAYAGPDAAQRAGECAPEEPRWRVDSLERWEYGGDELIIGELAEQRLPGPIPGSWEQDAIRPPTQEVRHG